MRTPEQAHDERFLELLHEESVAAHQVASYGKVLKDITRPAGVRWASEDYRTVATALKDAVALVEDGDDHIRSYSQRPSVFVEKYNVADAALGEAEQATADHEKNYTGWQRFFLVVSSAGLVHKDMRCSTCNKGRSATQFALLPSLSGRSIEALVEALGPTLCSVCFPQAPVDWTDAVRIPTKLAVILFEEGEEAFNVALAKHKAGEAAKANGPHRVKLSKDRQSCAHCGKPVKGVLHRWKGTTSYTHAEEA